MAYKTFEDVAEDLPRFTEEIYNSRGVHSAPSYPGPKPLRINKPGRWSNLQHDHCPDLGAHQATPFLGVLNTGASWASHLPNPASKCHTRCQVQHMGVD